MNLDGLKCRNWRVFRDECDLWLSTLAQNTLNYRPGIQMTFQFGSRPSSFRRIVYFEADVVIWVYCLELLSLLDLYTFRFGQKKLVRSEPSRRMRKTQTWVISWISLSSRSWLADTHFIILLKTRFLNLDSVFNFSFYESSKLKTLIFCNTSYKSKLQSFQ